MKKFLQHSSITPLGNPVLPLWGKDPALPIPAQPAISTCNSPEAGFTLFTFNRRRLNTQGEIITLYVDYKRFAR
jgi:hypothetical protein